MSKCETCGTTDPPVFNGWLGHLCKTCCDKAWESVQTGGSEIVVRTAAGKEICILKARRTDDATPS